MKRALIFLFLLIAVFSLSYTIRKGDVLRIEVVGYPDLTRNCAVDIEGAITFPYVGRVKKEGIDRLRKEMIGKKTETHWRTHFFLFLSPSHRQRT